MSRGKWFASVVLAVFIAVLFVLATGVAAK